MHLAVALLTAFGPTSPVCTVAAGPAYYAFDLITTKNIPGTGLAKGLAEVSVSGASPFSVALSVDGSYMYDVHVSLDRMKVPRQGQLVAWVTTSAVDRIVTVDGNGVASRCGDDQPQRASFEHFGQFFQLQIDDLRHLCPIERVKNDRLVDPIEEFRQKMSAERFGQRLADLCF